MSMRSFLFALALLATTGAGSASAESFTFQGYLENSGVPLDGAANLRFRVYSAAIVGSQIGDEVVENGYPVADGVFSIDLDFGSDLVFDGSARFLEVEVDGLVLGPRLAIQPAPLASSANALRGRNVSGSLPGAGDALVWNGAQWAPQAVGGGGSYTAGTGLNLTSNTFSVAPTYRLPQGCANGQVAQWNGTAWNCAADTDTTYTAGNGLTLTGTAFSVNFAGSGVANTAARSDHGHFGQTFKGSIDGFGLTVQQETTASGNSALVGLHAGNADTGNGVFGQATTLQNGTGVSGYGSGFGVRGIVDQPNATAAVFGLSQPGAPSSRAVLGRHVADGATAIEGEATSTSGFTVGVLGKVASPQGTGVSGENSDAAGVAVRGRVTGAAARGVFGENLATSGDAVGVYGVSSSGEGYGVQGFSAGASGNGAGVYGVSGSSGGSGVKAFNSANSGLAYAIHATTAAPGGIAVFAEAPGGVSGSPIGVYGETAAGAGLGVFARNTATGGAATALDAVNQAVGGTASTFRALGGGSARAIDAQTQGTTSSANAIRARLLNATSTGDAVYARSNSTSGSGGRFENASGTVVALARSNTSIEATGNAIINGDVGVFGTLSKGGGSFKIDHPLDPENKFLYHSFVESPDMMNIYNGNAVTDKNGYATIELPEWFDTLNRDFRYQLTAIGSFAQAIVAEEIEGNRFVIRTSAPAVKVSWQVTGVRQDPWAEAHRIQVEVEKSAAERGKYLHPEAWGQPGEKRLGLAVDGKRED